MDNNRKYYETIQRKFPGYLSGSYDGKIDYSKEYAELRDATEHQRRRRKADYRVNPANHTISYRGSERATFCYTQEGWFAPARTKVTLVYNGNSNDGLADQKEPMNVLRVRLAYLSKYMNAIYNADDEADDEYTKKYTTSPKTPEYTVEH